MYDSLILLDPDSEFSTESFIEELHRSLLGHPESPQAIVQRGQGISVIWPAYEFRIYRSEAPHVAEESKELAEVCEHPCSDRIRQCTVRFELSGDDDSDMKYFNDALLIGEAAQRCGRVYRFEQSSGAWLDVGDEAAQC